MNIIINKKIINNVKSIRVNLHLKKEVSVIKVKINTIKYKELKYYIHYI
jgi:hypothetical protein